MTAGKLGSSGPDSATVRRILAAWLAAAEARLAQPGKIDGRTLNRLGELILAAASWVADQERRALIEARSRAFLSGAHDGR